MSGELSTGMDFPSINPTSFDLVISATGLPSSLIAAAASFNGKSVLHIDSNPFYGSLYSSLSPSSFNNLPKPFSMLEISNQCSLESSRSFSIDLHGPRILFCAEKMVDLLIRSGAGNHVEFKSLDGNFIYWDGKLKPVPDSRQSLFKDKSLGLEEKSKLMKFFAVVKEHIEAAAAGGGGKIAEEDLNLPFVEFLEKQKLPPRLKAIVLYAIALADYDQESGEACPKLVMTKEAIDSIALYTSSIGRFPNAVGAFIYPMYGNGELPQAFCRCAAVKGSLYVLRMPMSAVLTDEENGHYKGVKLASGQEIFSHHLVVDSHFALPSTASSSVQLQDLCFSNQAKLIVRGVCITMFFIQHDLSNVLVVFPPRSLHSEQLATVRALQLGSNLAVCPQGFFLLYFSTLCNDANQGGEYIRAAMSSLKRASSDGPTTCNDDEKSAQNNLDILWSAIYVQELREELIGTISLCATPDASLDYENTLESAIKLFSAMYPGEEFLPQTSPPEDAEEEDGGSFD